MVNIKKASGEIVPFDPDKLRHSLNRIGADKHLIEQIVTEVNTILHDEMSTHDIYRIALRLLRKKSRTLSAKYHLKRAIMRLGITGYPFEKFIAEIFRNKGFETQTNYIIKGFCVAHEVDVVAINNEKNIYIECKYHHRQGIKSTVKTPLYVKARFEDIEKARKTRLPHFEGWLITNTRFTTDATQYGNCAGLHLVAWDYPQKGSLKEQIEISGLYPITCITDFTKTELEILFANNIVLCKQIADLPRIINKLKISDNRKNSILKQCENLCQIFKSN